MAVGAIGAASSISALTQPTSASATSAAKPTDSTAFAKALDKAANLTMQADSAAGQVATGQISSIQQFTSSAAKAELAVDLTVAIRNRAIDAYQEIMRMSV